MKTIARLLLSLVFVSFISLGAFAQDDNSINQGSRALQKCVGQMNEVSVTLEATISMRVTNPNVFFKFERCDQYLRGIVNPLKTIVEVCSTCPFRVGVFTDQDYFIASDGGVNCMAINNLGYSVESVGNYLYDPLRYTKIQTEVIDIQKAPLGSGYTFVWQAPHTCGDPSTGNQGSYDDNRFEIQWEMGTKVNTMNQEDMLHQGFCTGVYTLPIKYMACTWCCTAPVE